VAEILIHSPKSPPVSTVFRTSFFAFAKFSMHNVSHMNVHRIYDLTVVHCFNSFLT